MQNKVTQQIFKGRANRKTQDELWFFSLNLIRFKIIICRVKKGIEFWTKPKIACIPTKRSAVAILILK